MRYSPVQGSADSVPVSFLPSFAIPRVSACPTCLVPEHLRSVFSVPPWQILSFHQLSALYLATRHSSLAASPCFSSASRLCVSVSLWQTPCSQYFADSLSSPQKSTPLESIRSRLFCQNARLATPSPTPSLHP